MAYERSHNAAIQSREKVLLVLDLRMRTAAPRSANVRRSRRSPWRQRSTRTAAQGVTMNAMASEKSIAALAPMGMGRMYGPIRPPTKAIGKTARMTAKVSKNGRIANFADRFNRDERPASSTVVREVKVPHNVFHDNDGVINQNSDAEDEGEEGDPIERETQQVKNQQRERERGGYGNCNNQRFAPAQQKEDEQRHTDHGNGHVKEKFVGLFCSRFAVVPRVTDTSTSDGITLPFSASTRRNTSLATEIAFAPAVLPQ